MRRMQNPAAYHVASAFFMIQSQYLTVVAAVIADSICKWLHGE